MTIKVTTTRHKRHMDPWVTGPSSYSLEKAAVSLIKYEFGFGGQIHYEDSTTICTDTTVLAARDIVRFEGSKKDIGILRLLAAVCGFMRAEGIKNGSVYNVWESVAGDKSGVALWARHFMPLVVSQSTSQVALAFLIFGNEIQEDEDAGVVGQRLREAIKPYKLETLIKAAVATLTGTAAELEMSPVEILDFYFPEDDKFGRTREQAA